MKIVFVEPNLKDSFGHGYMVMRSIKNYIGIKNNKNQFFLVSNHHISNRAKKSFKKIYPVATVDNFGSKNSKTVYRYLKEIIKKFDLEEKDLVVYTTAHINEIKAVSMLENNAPRFLLQVHQFFAPSYDSGVIDLKIFNKTKKGFENAFKNISRNTTVVTTSNNLSDILEKISERDIPVMDVPMLIIKDTKNNKKYDFSFLGDGRKEKGMSLFVKAAISLIGEGWKYNFLFQQPNLRYFNKSESVLLKHDIAEMKNKYKKNIKVINKKLSQAEYNSIMINSKSLVLPYDPRHYDKRVSGISIECGCLGIPIITSSNTTMGNKIKTGKQSGIVFKYQHGNKQSNTKNLVDVMKLFKANEYFYTNRAKKLEASFSKSANIEKFIDQCIKLSFKSK